MFVHHVWLNSRLLSIFYGKGWGVVSQEKLSDLVKNRVQSLFHYNLQDALLRKVILSFNHLK